MVLMYIWGFGIHTLRLVFGPLPELMCKIGTFGVHFFGMTTCFLAVAIGWIKVAFAYFYKSIPVIEDKLFAIFIMIHAYMMALLVIGSKTLLDQKHMLINDVS